MGVLLVLVERCGCWHERDGARPGESTRGIGGRLRLRDLLLQGLDEYALETAHVDQVYGESPPACGIETLRGVAFSQPYELVSLPELGPWQRTVEETLGIGRDGRGPCDAALRLICSGALRV